MAISKKVNLVLLPGLDGTGLLFRPFVETLPDWISTTTIAYPTDQSLSVSDLAELVTRRLPEGEVVILAESFSGLVALTLLLQQGPIARCIIFCASFAEPLYPWALGPAAMMPGLGALIQRAPTFLLRKFCIGPTATTDQLGFIREALGAVSPRVIEHRLKLIARRHSFDQIRFTVPCYYLQASNDRLVPSACAGWFKDRFEQFRLIRIEGPHFLLQSRPKECAELIQEILKPLVPR